MKIVLTCFGANLKLHPSRSRLLLSLRGCSWLLLSFGACALAHGFASNNIFAAANIEWHILQIVVVKLTCLGNPELTFRECGLKPSNKKFRYLPELFNVSVQYRLERVCRIMLDITEGLNIVPFDIFFEPQSGRTTVGAHDAPNCEAQGHGAPSQEED